MFPRSVVLVVDDLAANRAVLEAQLLPHGYDVRQAANGVEALDVIDAGEPDLILLDINMPKMDGLELCRRLKADPRRRLIPIVLLTAQVDRATRLAGRAAGADDFLTKPFDLTEVDLRSRVLLQNRALNLELDGAEGIILALARAVEARDLFTVHHAERVGRYATAIGRAHGLGEAELEGLYRGGVLHDLGKIAIPDAILLKPTALTVEEWAQMQTHSEEGERIASPLRSMAALLPTIRHHHERVDGTGYPDHLAAAEIPLNARIVAVADSYDAMVSDRPYRAAMDVEEARRRIAGGSGTQFDPEFADTFLRLLDDGLASSVRSDERERRRTQDAPSRGNGSRPVAGATTPA